MLKQLVYKSVLKKTNEGAAAAVYRSTTENRARIQRQDRSGVSPNRKGVIERLLLNAHDLASRLAGAAVPSFSYVIISVRSAFQCIS